MALITVLSQSGTLPTAATIQGWLHAIRTAAPWPKTASGKFFRKRNSKLLEDADEGPIERPAESGVTNPPDRPRAHNADMRPYAPPRSACPVTLLFFFSFIIRTLRPQHLHAACRPLSSKGPKRACWQPPDCAHFGAELPSK